ncbi:MAG: translation initiation factor IF-2 [Candidatus Taylorbacteria bacterium RIFCSPHIGHO2_01_FULL_46_22b]|uniref:Translation initiation factor IF-2 n=1 Tax=Candidatus Taylorbacteria bacterium RIFCSPHIGHO2_01_FULL_46_22b TaxID=1802301 RepID=A0A1G2M1K1_9BACT|nr:MAG: translation initiation factor IF-2 [Candidatus Taylorbacteria bacterium RIFCSPHIGHO2_01_FULL_46_22b]
MKKEQTQKAIVKRAPVVIVMGHIDHGKSTLLDYIRKSNTVDKEKGGITQHIGAYEAIFTDKTSTEHRLTFIDTPGHAAFCSIREHGSKAADLAVLVVSGEDGVKPQTLEALGCIKAAKLPYLVAINKIDRPNVDIERIKANLAEHEVYLEGYGGDISWVAISALTGKGIPELLETLVLMADIQNLTGDLSQPATGFVIEAHVDQKKGVIATLIIKEGTLHTGDMLLSGKSYSPVRSIEIYPAIQTKEAVCGQPVRIAGWNELPVVGDIFTITASRSEAEKQVAAYAQKIKSLKQQSAVATEIEGEVDTATIPLVLKADTLGSLAAVKHEIEKVKIENVIFKILSSTVGAISENDIKTASTSKNSLLIGFNIKTDQSAKASAERLGISVMTFDIIYRLTEWLTEEATKRRPKKEIEEETGRIKVLKLFSGEKGRFVIGGKVESGMIKSGATIKILRRDTEIGRGKIKGLQHLKDKVDEVGTGKEFGAMIESKIEPAPGDRFEAFVVTVK